ncbi:MAG TPA: cation:proton antiporter [Flavobacteriaceae bacterium]|nr:cation:proton antiporter [Flavobacteriaceae bacterium]
MNEFLEILQHEFHLPLSNPVLVFALILVIILVSPLLFRKINIPGIIVLIISGIVVGPHGLGILEENTAIELLSTIGIIYIMFIAGLELDMNEFKANRHKSLLFGFYTFAIPMIIGFPVCYYLLEIPFNASILTTSMFATHTLVAYPIVSNYNVVKNQAVAITVGATILADAAVLTTLAVIVENSNGDLNQAFWIRLIVSMIVFLAIMFYLVPKIAKWFFRTMQNERHSHYIFVLAVVFIASFLSELAGLEPIIGAFVAGLAINPLIPHSSALMNRIEFIGNSLFIPFFLISVGMLVDISVIFSGASALILAGVLTLVAVFSKWLAAWVAQLSFRYSKTQRNLMFGLSTSRAAATLAVILVGYEAGIVSETILNGTVILILITCIVSSFVTERAAKKLVVQEENENDANNDTKKNNEHILLPIANIVNFEKLLEFAMLIKNKDSENPINILSVVPNDETAEENVSKAKEKLEVFVKQGSAVEIDVNILTSIDHNIASGIARTSKEIVADTLILGWPASSGFLDKFIGGKMKKIIKLSNKTTFVCHIAHPWATHKRLFMAVPPYAEKMSGFEHWLKKAIRLSKELSIPMLVNCDEKTQNHIESMVKKQNLKAPITFNLFEDWNDFLFLAKKVQEDDVMMVISARKNTHSYQHIMENLPVKLDKYFRENSKIIVYPEG